MLCIISDEGHSRNVLCVLHFIILIKKSLMIQRGNQIPWGSKGVIRFRKSKNDKGTNSDVQNITQKTKDRTTRTPLKTGGEFRCSGKVSSPFSNSDIRRVTPVTKPVIKIYVWCSHWTRTTIEISLVRGFIYCTSCCSLSCNVNFHTSFISPWWRQYYITGN